MSRQEQRQGRNSMVRALALLAAFGGCREQPPPSQDETDRALAATADSYRVVTPQTATARAPEADLTVPVTHAGAAEPVFEPLPDSALLRVDRTGTYGGTLVYAALGEVESFNPIDAKGTTAQELRELVFDSLLGYSNGAREMYPKLARSWEVSDDQLTWTFYLRQGVRWSDGRPVTIDDVEWSFRAVLDPRYPSGIQDGFRDADGELPEITVDRAADAIRFRTRAVRALLPVHVGTVSILPKHKWSESFEDGTLLTEMTNDIEPADLVGTGPFQLQRYVPGEKIEYRRNPWHWKADARGKRLPYLDRVVIAIVKDNNLRWQKFAGGEHDLLQTFPVEHFREAVALEKSGRAELHRLGLGLSTHWFGLNLHPGTDPTTGAPFVDPDKRRWFETADFRRALNHAIDRDGLVRAALKDRGEPVWSQVTRGNVDWHNPDVRKYPYDPDTARGLLDGLGWRDGDGDGVREDTAGRKLAFTTNTNVESNLRQQLGALIQKDFRAVGVELHLKPVTFNDLSTSLRDSHRWESMILGWGSGVPPDPANSKHILLSHGRLHVWYPQQPAPQTAWEARVDELVGRMDQELDPIARKRMSDEILELTAEHAPLFYLAAGNAYAMAKPGLGNLWPSVLRPELSWNLDELYWRDAAR